MILHTQPRGKWNKHDFLLIEAYQTLQDERCNQCGLPRWICGNDDPDIAFKILEDTCFAKREMESLQNAGDSVDERTRKAWGVATHPKPITFSGKELGLSVRDAYYEAEMKRLNPEAEPT